MPSKTAKQRRFMAAAAHNPEFARKADIPQSVAREFHQADRHDRVSDKRKARRTAIKRAFDRYGQVTDKVKK